MNKQFEVKIDFANLDIISKRLILVYDMQVVNYSDEKIDKKLLEKEVKNLIPKTERKFIKIEKISKKTVSFYFDAEAFFDSKLKLAGTNDRYIKRLIVNTLPSMILNNVSAIDYNKVVEESFRNYLNKNIELKNKISNCIAKNTPIMYFKFRYDYSLNSILLEIKPEFRHNIIAVLKSKKSPNKELKKMDFDSSVETYLYFKNKRK